MSYEACILIFAESNFFLLDMLQHIGNYKSMFTFNAFHPLLLHIIW